MHNKYKKVVWDMLVCGKIDFQLKHCTAKGGRHQLNLKTINYKSYSTNNVFRD
jgi:hypothetical protein